MSVESIEHVHWFLRSGCNNPQRCAFCFGPASGEIASSQRDVQLATKIVENENVGRVILGGGEPTLGDVDSIIERLKKRRIRISLHTNGLTLTEASLDRWARLGLDEIALPIDAVNREIQRSLRGGLFLGVHDHLMAWVERINARGIGVRYHTVFARKNREEIPRIYDLIKGQPFNDWRIYEFNDDLARAAWLKMEGIEERKKIGGIARVEVLRRLGTPEAGYTDCLLADFVLMEEKMRRSKDSRVRFMVRIDQEKGTNIFLRSSGDVDCYSWYSSGERGYLGNLLIHGFPVIEQRLAEINNQERDEGTWADAWGSLPIWARLYEGNYYIEEYEEDIKRRYRPKVERLARLWEKRTV